MKAITGLPIRCKAMRGKKLFNENERNVCRLDFLPLLVWNNAVSIIEVSMIVKNWIEAETKSRWDPFIVHRSVDSLYIKMS